MIYLVSFAAGAMLAAAFLGILPEAIHKSEDPHLVLGITLASIVLFFILEKFLYWFHCHDGHCAFQIGVEKEKKAIQGHHHVHPVGIMNLIGDGLHNLLDGAFIAGAFMTDVSLGIVATIAVVLHEIPQEVGDFGVLVYAGFSRLKALMFNFLSAVIAIVGALAAYYIAPAFEMGEVVLLALAAGSFIYIGAADLLPELHREADFYDGSVQTLMFFAGILLMWLAGTFAHGLVH